jgi:uncharacterized protein YjbI with pentapeptide repeats
VLPQPVTERVTGSRFLKPGTAGRRSIRFTVMSAGLPRRRRPGDQAPVRPGDAGEARLWRIGAALAVSFTVAVAGLAGLTWLAWVLLGAAGFRQHGAPSLHDTVGVLQLVFASVAGAGALVALIVAYRRQKIAEADSAHDRTRVYNERFTTIAAQLGDAQPAVRLAGAHAMAGLADDWKQNRQTCVDVLCAYLRLPYDPDPGGGAAPAEWSAYRANREVRHTIIRLIGAHLRPSAAMSWQGLDLDFTGAVFDGGDFSGALFSGGTVSFDGAEFSGGMVRFDGAEFSGGMVRFDNAVFSGGAVSFYLAEFSGGTVSFENAEFSGGTVDFSGTVFSGGMVGFFMAGFSGGTVSFYLAVFSGGTLSFSGAVFSRGTVVFGGASFSGGSADFGGAVFSGVSVDFGGAGFSGGSVSFSGAGFSGGPVSFDGAEFSGGVVDFSGAVFSSAVTGGTVSFVGAGFSGGRVDFGGARFSGGKVDFGGAGCWSHPPEFDWDAKPPAGVTLPAGAP